jgi:hypothetical protein
VVMHLDVDEFGGLDFDEFVEAWFLVPEGVKGVLMKEGALPSADTGDKGDRSSKLKREASNPRLKREVSSPRSGAGAEETRRNSSKPKRVLSYRVEESKKHPEKDRPPTKARCTILWSAMDRFYIPPGSPPRITWDLSMCLLIMWYAAVTPLRVGFDLFAIEGEKEMETVRLPAVGLRARHQSLCIASVVTLLHWMLQLNLPPPPPPPPRPPSLLFRCLHVSSVWTLSSTCSPAFSATAARLWRRSRSFSARIAKGGSGSTSLPVSRKMMMMMTMMPERAGASVIATVCCVCCAPQALHPHHPAAGFDRQPDQRRTDVLRHVCTIPAPCTTSYARCHQVR